MVQKLVLASNNAGKVREFQELLAPFRFQVIPQGELGIPSAEEPHHTFVENALAKARHASAASGLPALADDSGICAHALDGAPGVYSARYAGVYGDSAANNQKLIASLQGKADRGAHYVCALVMVNSANDPEPLIVQTRWHGQIIDDAKGAHGFGYDPIFQPEGFSETFAQLPLEMKNKIGHRGKATQLLIAFLKKKK